MPPKIELKGKVEEDAYSKVLDSARESITRFGDAVSNFGSKLGDMLRVPLAALAGTAQASSARFREAAFALRKTTGATGEKLDGLLGSFDRARSETRASVDDTAAVVSTLSQRLGLTGDSLSDASIAVLRIAKTAGGDAAQTASAVAEMAAAWGISGRDLAGRLEGFRAASLRTAGGASEFAALLTRSAPTLKTLGLSFDDAVAMLSQMDAAGVPADVAIAGLTKGLTKLAKDGATDIRASLLEHVERIVRTPGAATAAGEAAELFGKNGLVMADAARKGLLAVNAANARLRAGVPSSERLFRALGDLRLKVENAVRPVGQAIDRLLIPAMVAATKALGAVVDAVGGVIAAFGNLPEWLQTTIVVIAGIAAIVGPALLFAGTMLELATAFIGKHMMAMIGLKIIPAALKALAWGGIAGAALGFARGLDSTAQSSPAVKAAVVAAGLAVSGAGADVGRASDSVIGSVSQAVEGLKASAKRPEMPALQPLPAFVPPAPQQFSHTPPTVPGVTIPPVDSFDVPSVSPDWSGAFDWMRQFTDAMGRSSTVPFVNVPMYGDVRGGAAPTGDAALAFLAQVGRLRGIRFNTDPAAIESEVARARGMLTLGDTYRLHAWNMESVYSQLRNMIVGPTPILDMNSPEAWMLRATEVDRVIAENASRTQYFADQRAANDAFWINETTQRNQWSQWNARQQQQALTMANPRPNVYLPEDIMRAAGQAFNQAFGAGGTFGGAAAPPPPPRAPAPTRRQTTAPQIGSFTARVGRSAAPAPARPGRAGTPLPDELAISANEVEKIPAGQRFGSTPADGGGATSDSIPDGRGGRTWRIGTRAADHGGQSDWVMFADGWRHADGSAIVNDEPYSTATASVGGAPDVPAWEGAAGVSADEAFARGWYFVPAAALSPDHAAAWPGGRWVNDTGTPSRTEAVYDVGPFNPAGSRPPPRTDPRVVSRPAAASNSSNDRIPDGRGGWTWRVGTKASDHGGQSDWVMFADGWRHADGTPIVNDEAYSNTPAAAAVSSGNTPDVPAWEGAPSIAAAQAFSRGWYFVPASALQADHAAAWPSGRWVNDTGTPSRHEAVYDVGPFNPAGTRPPPRTDPRAITGGAS